MPRDGLLRCARNDGGGASAPYSTFTLAGAGCSAAGIRDARRVRHAGQRGGVALLRIGAGLHHAGRHDQGRGVFGAHVDFDDLALRHVEEETRGRFGAQGRNTEMCSSSPGKLAGDVHARRLRDQDDRPHPRRGKLDQADLAEARPLAREQRLEHLLQAAIDRAHHGHAAEQALAEIDHVRPIRLAVRKPSSVSATTATTSPEPGTLNGR